MQKEYSGKEAHPVLPLLPEAGLAAGGVSLEEYYAKRASVMRLMEEEPLLYGYEPPVWELADTEIASLRAEYPTGVITLLVLGGNRGSKTKYGAKRLVQKMLDIPGARCWGLQSTEAASRADQQGVVFEHIPSEFRPESGRLRQGRVTKVVYSTSGGFTENTFVLPNGSQCWFKFYSANVKTLEGAELDFAWADELIPPDWVEALRFRLLNRNGLLLITFTPIEGYSSTVKEFLDDAVSLWDVDAPLLVSRDGLSFEKVPRVQKSGRSTARIIYFHTCDNPFGNYEAMKVECLGSSRERILTRAYGVPTKAISAAFPLFSERVHVIPAARFEKIAGLAKGSRFMFVDPCSGRNWFMIWVYCTRSARFIYREWPSGAYVPGVGTLGAWAVPSAKVDGERGPGQEELGWSLLRYKEEILRVEKGEAIYERWIDARYGNTPTVTSEEATTLIRELAGIGLSFMAAPGERAIFSDNPDGSLRLINDALYYDSGRELGRGNEPKLFVCENCPNTIYALKTWTGKDGRHGATKDPVDCVRMLVLSGSEYVDEEMLAPKRPWMKQFAMR